MKIKIETYLPLFPGFYNTVFEPNEDWEISDINNERELKGLKPIDYEQCVFDYDDYRIRVSKECVSYIDNQLKHILGKSLSVTFQSLFSPKEYNYNNDSINVEIVINKTIVNKIRKYLNDNLCDFTVYLEKYTSGSGFISYYSDDVNVWINDYLNSLEKNNHYLGSILDFILANEGIEHINMFENIESNISATNYYDLIED